MAPLPFPRDLVLLQADWERTYAELIDGQRAPLGWAARSRLRYLSARLAAHPYWVARSGRMTGWADLRRQARRFIEAEEA